MTDSISEVQAGVAAAFSHVDMGAGVYTDTPTQPAVDDDDRLTFAAIEGGTFRAVYQFCCDHKTDIAAAIGAAVVRQGKHSSDGRK